MFQPSAVNCLQPSILVYFPGLKARIESRENWMPAKNGRHDGARIAAPSPPLGYFTLTSLAISFAC